MTMTTSRAFTLVETMVAIAVLAIALVGPFIAVQNALRASYIARDQLVAAHLAQEGMEYIRSVRDANYLNNRAGGWLDGFSAASRDLCYSLTSTAPSGVCILDPIRGDFHASGQAAAMDEQASHAAAPVLNLDASRRYTQQAGSATSFKRTVQITTLSATEIRVTITVSWTTLKQTYSVVVSDTLRDWL